MAPEMCSFFADERDQSQQQKQRQQQQIEAPEEPAIGALRQREEMARVEKVRISGQENERRAKGRLLLTEGNISFYWKNYA